MKVFELDGTLHYPARITDQSLLGVYRINERLQVVTNQYSVAITGQ